MEQDRKPRNKPMRLWVPYFWQRRKNIQWGKYSLFNKWCWENWTAPCQRMQLEHSLTPYPMISSKWIKYLNVRSETIKLFKENIGRTLNYINKSNILYDPPPRVMEIKTKINMWDLIKHESFCTAKETTNKVKRQPSEWEKLVSNETTNKRLISKINKQFIQVNTRKTNNPIKKGGEDLKDISPKKTYRWLTNTWKDAQHLSLSEKCKS